MRAVQLFSGFFLFALLFPSPVLAEATFNPNMIITDAELFDYTSMGKESVQAFLESRKSTLSGYKDVDVTTNVLAPASEIIHNASKLYQVNPRYILVVLQKEQSLVESQNPKQRQYDWATGYAVCDSCSMDDPAIQKYKGFAKQIDHAAGAARWWKDNQDRGSFKKVGVPITIDETTVTPENYATGFLYTYTPHIHGNKNFWKIWNRWFTRVFPNGSVVQVKGEPAVYLLEKGYRRAFTSSAALTSRFDPSQIIQIEKSDLLTYDEGAPIKFPNYSLLRSPNSMVFLLRDDTLHYIASAETLRQLGYNPDEIIDVTQEDVDAYYQGKIITTATVYPLGAVLQERKSKQLYYVEQGKRQPILHKDIAKILFPQHKILLVDEKTIAQYPLIPRMLTFKEGSLVAAHGSPLIYVVSDGMRRHVPNEDVFKGLGYKMENVLRVEEQALLGSPLGQPVTLNK